MNKINRITFLTTFLIMAYLLSACSGVPAGVKVDDSSSNSQSQAGQVSEVVFTGTVEAINGNQVTVSGQVITVDSAVLAAANVVVGDNIKVEAQVGQDGIVTAVSVELSGSDDNANSNDNNQNDSNANDNGSNSNDDQNGNSNGNDNSNVDNQQEVTGTVDAITTDSITIDGVVYMIADFTEFKDLIAMGDQVKIHVIVNADGTLTIREIEKTAGTSLDNGNSNSNGSDDNSNLNSNSNSDDHGDNSNGSDDNSNDNGNDNSGSSNSNDDSGGGNGNGNG
jgi:hypothetical protein